MALLDSNKEDKTLRGLSGTEVKTSKGSGIFKTFKEIGKYFSEIYLGITSLARGMQVTGKYFVKPSSIVTQQYPENRAELKMFDSFKGELILKHTEDNEHFCDACNSCARVCPNGSIEIISKREVGADGKSKRTLDKYIYHLDTCTFCGLCVPACDQNAIAFSQEFEHAVFDRSRLVKQLNAPESKVVEKQKTEEK